MKEEEKIKLLEIIEELEDYRGRHTELVTVYAPAGANINQISSQIRSEQSTAQNIKSKTTRKNVIDALEKIVRHLKLYKKLPENGLAIFCGNVSKAEGQADIRIWAIEPSQPLKVRFYRCDQTFVLEPFHEMLEVKEVYGLIVIDRKEATFGLLEGKHIKVLKHITSGVPGKYKAGGQCLSGDSLVMLGNGDVIEIKNCHNPLKILSVKLDGQKTSFSSVKTKWENKKKLFIVTTKYPRTTIKASYDHIFFVRTEKGIEEKPLSDLKVGDYLIMPEKINLNLKDQEIKFIPKIKRKKDMKKVRIPGFINKEFARLLGYYLGDGSYERDRISFSEQREDVTLYYKKLIEKIFKIETRVKFRKEKNYYQIRVYSRLIAQLFKEIFPLSGKTLNEHIPSIILKSSDISLVGFITGFFDAEGYISGYRAAVGINNKIIIKQLQLALLRLGIISSIWEYDNRRNPYSKNKRYTLVIEDGESLEKFAKIIKIASQEKHEKLKKILSKRKNRSNIRQILINGKKVRELFRKHGQIVHKFGLSGFFGNKRQLNKKLFKERLIDSTNNPLIKKELLKFYNSELIPVKINNIEPVAEKTNAIDIETSSNNFIANGLLVHNSAARFDRLRKELGKEFFRRASEKIKDLFFDMPKLKNILLGGPGPTKEDWLKEGQLVTALRRKILAIKDIGYADEHGLKLLVEASQEELAEEEIMVEKAILEKFFMTLAKEPGKAIYGEINVKNALKVGAVSNLLISTVIDKKLSLELRKRAVAIRAEIHFISTETNEGLQFKNLSGVGAILRFAV